MSLIPASALRHANNKWAVNSLFVEGGGKWLTLEEEDSPCGAMSLHKLYMAYAVSDPTEMTLAESIFGNWKSWDAVRSSKLLNIHGTYDRWKEEADIRRKSLAFQAILKEAQEGKSPMQAAKYLIEEPWKMRAASSREDKRKTRQKSRETTLKAAEDREFQEDLERLKERLN